MNTEDDRPYASLSAAERLVLRLCLQGITVVHNPGDVLWAWAPVDVAIDMPAVLDALTCYRGELLALIPEVA